MLIKLYKYSISPLIRNQCRFNPSCSTYAIDAINKHGNIKGVYLTILRILRCNPFFKGGNDKIP
ncbi:membrane protein insertion efficiency factor YidD [Candidatus Kinetoplastidibacterium blastocrithidiae]